MPAREAMIGARPVWQAPADKVSFRRDVLPILRRAGTMQWVAAASFLGAAWHDIGDLSDPAMIETLAKSVGRRAGRARKRCSTAFRKPGGEDRRVNAMPIMLGDGVNYPDSPHSWLALTPTQYRVLELWADGKFDADYTDAAADAMPYARRSAGRTAAGGDDARGARCLLGRRLPSRRRDHLADPPQGAVSRPATKPSCRSASRCRTARRSTTISACSSTAPTCSPAIRRNRIRARRSVRRRRAI